MPPKPKTGTCVPPKLCSHFSQVSQPRSGNVRGNGVQQNGFFKPRGQHSVQLSYPVKRQTCFHCGIPGHIARNCKNQAYVSFEQKSRKAKSWNANKSKSMKVSPPKTMPTSRSKTKPSDGDWVKAKVKCTQNERSTSCKEKKQLEPRSSTVKQYWRPKQSLKQETPISSQSFNRTAKTKMIWMNVFFIDNNGKPRSTMAWVPKTN